MMNTHPKTCKILVAAASLALVVLRVQAQPAAPVEDPARYEVGCSIQAPSGFQACEEPPARSCEAEADYASQPSKEPTSVVFANRSGKPVKVYWLNFQGARVL